MVIIKYNTMAMTIKTLANRLQSRKRTLRSAYKHSPQDNNNTGCSGDDKVIDQIKKQIEHQQTINASKSQYPLHEDLKVFEQIVPEQELHIKSEKKVQSGKTKSQILERNVFSEKSPQINLNIEENSLEEQIKSKQRFQKQQPNLFTPPSKTVIRNLKNNQNSPYKEERKSYRKFRRRVISSVPYRKCQDQFEQKIVTLMNKICHKKNNEKDIDTLCDKIQKISPKDIYNPYVISGIQTILNLLEKNQEVNVTTLAKLKKQVKNLSEKILMELGKTDQYEQIVIEEKKVDMELTKPRMMRKVYKMLIQNRKVNFKEARQKSFYVCQSFFQKFNNHANEDDILLFLKESKFLNL